MKSERITHAFDPVFSSESRILILGTMPSPKSRELGFYYSHPRNRFWPVLAKIFGEELPKAPEEKQDFCLRHKIALWDVLKECDIAASLFSFIEKVIDVKKVNNVVEASEVSSHCDIVIGKNT